MKKIIVKAKNVTVAQTKRVLKDKPKAKKVILKSIRVTERISRIQILDRSRTYEAWLKKHTPNKIKLESQRAEAEKFKYRPKISIITPVYNTPVKLLEECINSVLNQTYDNFELILVDDCSTSDKTIKTLKKYLNNPKIKIIFNKVNLHISGATNEGIKQASGTYIGLLDHDDVLYPHALYEVVKSLNVKKHDFIYSDEDKLFSNGKRRSSPFFKPDWSSDYLRSINYITHFSVIKKSLVESVGGFRSEFDGAQDWDLFLRTTRKAKSIHHIQDVLYGWRMTDNSTAQDTGAKPYVVAAQKKALSEDLKARGLEADIKRSRYVKDYWEVNYKVVGSPKVSIVIPTKNQCKVLKRCIDSILKKTTYKNYEIILVDTGSTEKEVLDFYKNIKSNKKIKHHSFIEKQFSYANSCNYGAKQASGEYLIMLNNDTEVITPNWIELMLGDAQRKEIGTVGVRLFFPDKKHIQHAGIGLGLGGYAANILSESVDKMLNGTQILYYSNKRNVAANTAACLMIEKKLFINLRGFDNHFSVTYNDVDLGLRVLKRGLLNVYNPAVTLIHHESLSLGLPDEKKRNSKEFNLAKQRLLKRWPNYIESDPYFNDNFDKGRADFTINRA